METHRPGPLKQRNKAHKSVKKRISKKDGINRLRTTSISSLRSISSKGGSTVSKTVRKNQITQLRKCKREELLNARRGIEIPPVLIAVLNLADCSIEQNEKLVAKIQTIVGDGVNFSKTGSHMHFVMNKFRTSYEVVLIDPADINGALDLAKITDILLIVHSPALEETFDTDGNILDPRRYAVLDSIYNHSLPQTVHALVDVANGADTTTKKRETFKKSLIQMISKNYPGTMDALKLRPLESTTDFLQFFHYSSNVKRRANSYCSRRSQILAESIEFVPSFEDPESGFLTVEGFVRNAAFNVNSLVYVPEFGEFQLEAVEGAPNPFQKRARPAIYEQFQEVADPELRPSLQERMNPVETLFEQEMDNLDEIDDDEFDGQDAAMGDEKAEAKKMKKKKIRVPKGTSDYQSAWIVDAQQAEVDESDDDDDDDESDDIDSQEDVQERKRRQVRFAPTAQSADEFEDSDNDYDDAQEDLEDMEVAQDAEDESYDQEMDLDDEQKQLAKFRESSDYQMFPDEIDTPVDVPARERFRQFKGLKSFRTSVWDAKENLPADYSRISQFENFNRTKRRLFKTDPVGAEPGFYVRARLLNAPKAMYDTFTVSHPNRPLILHQLLAHEHKLSVMNIVLKKVPTYAQAVQSKEKLVFHIGCRRFETQAIFSAHSTGDKHKYEKFLRDDVACVATIYAPITFPPAPVLVFKILPSGRQQLVATGSLLDCNPDRLIIKRFILSGHPFKINRKHAVVRYMFFNREDILWFRPIELRTKYGRRGHIQEPLGTHGHMKCIFDAQLCSQDTVLLCLYKRVFPKWPQTLPLF